MTLEEMQLLCEKYEDKEYLEFQKIKNPKSKRPDLCAFIKLNELVSSDNDIISSAEHDEIYLSIDLELLSEIITEEDIIFFIRCGIRFDFEDNVLKMFV